MVITPDIPTLPYVLKNGAKCFELIAEPVERELLPGLFIKGWGYNGTIPGPTIMVYPGDCVCIRVCNRLPEPTSVHWHGLDVPNVMDGVPDMQPSPLIEPGEYFDYHFRIINPPGTHMYHTHFFSSTQQMLGLAGGFIILDPRDCVDRDYFLMLQEFEIEELPMGEVKPGHYDIDPLSHTPNFFTINGRCFPYTTPLEVFYGEKIRIRMANPVVMSHPMHIHGHQFLVTASDGNMIAPRAQLVKNTVHVASGETWDIEFVANNPGVWPFHCHIPHHMANNHQKKMGGMVTTIVYNC